MTTPPTETAAAKEDATPKASLPKGQALQFFVDGKPVAPSENTLAHVARKVTKPRWSAKEMREFVANAGVDNLLTSWTVTFPGNKKLSTKVVDVAALKGKTPRQVKGETASSPRGAAAKLAQVEKAKAEAKAVKAAKADGQVAPETPTLDALNAKKTAGVKAPAKSDRSPLSVLGEAAKAVGRQQARAAKKDVTPIPKQGSRPTTAAGRKAAAKAQPPTEDLTELLP